MRMKHTSTPHVLLRSFFHPLLMSRTSSFSPRSRAPTKVSMGKAMRARAARAAELRGLSASPAVKVLAFTTRTSSTMFGCWCASVSAAAFLSAASTSPLPWPPWPPGSRVVGLE